jgi:hypothetical protein
MEHSSSENVNLANKILKEILPEKTIKNQKELLR